MYMHTHMHAHAHMCAHTCMHVKHDKHGYLHGSSYLQFANMFILAFCVCVCMNIHVHMSREKIPVFALDPTRPCLD